MNDTAGTSYPAGIFRAKEKTFIDKISAYERHIISRKAQCNEIPLPALSVIHNTYLYI